MPLLPRDVCYPTFVDISPSKAQACAEELEQMSPTEALTTETQLPFAVDAAVLEQVEQFRRQQQAALQFVAGPGTTTDNSDCPVPMCTTGIEP